MSIAAHRGAASRKVMRHPGDLTAGNGILWQPASRLRVTEGASGM